MICPKCNEEMEGEIVHRWNIVTWMCEECEVSIDEDITGDLIDYAKEAQREKPYPSHQHNSVPVSTV